MYVFNLSRFNNRFLAKKGKVVVAITLKQHGQFHSMRAYPRMMSAREA